MMRIAWATDIHLNFAQGAAEELCDEARRAGAGALLLGGDIAEAPTLLAALETFERYSPCPVYFVLGNHDFYRGSIARVRKEVEAFTAGSRRLVWLSRSGPVALTPKSGLVGHDGWGDARYGDFLRSDVMLNDFIAIEELKDKEKVVLQGLLQGLGDEAAAHLRKVLPEALSRFEEVVVLTHVPPFLEASMHEGRISSQDWLPMFTCKAAGDAISAATRVRPDRRVTVLCGHTHSAADVRPLTNLTVRAGAAEYGKPRLQQPLIEVS